MPAPSNVVASSAITDQASADGTFNNAVYSFANSYVGWLGSLTELSGVISDEFTAGIITPNNGYAKDSRHTIAPVSGASESDNDLNLLTRSQLLLSAYYVEKYEKGSGLSKAGIAFALDGYMEVFLAEDYCAGLTLSEVLPQGGVTFGYPLTTDSLLDTAVAHFDSALAHAAGNDTVTALASLGLGRALLDLGDFDSAAKVVNGVPTGFAYNIASNVPPAYGLTNLYAENSLGLGSGNPPCALFNISDREGTNGLNFVSAGDPRMPIDSTIIETCDGAIFGWPDSVYYSPLKFGNPSTEMPLATGVEARLIEAEAALHDNQPGTWANDLNALRADSVDTHVTFDTSQVPIKVDSTTGTTPDEQVSFMYRERAFWLFGTGTRLGDLRRLMRQYGREAESVFPTGTYEPEMQGISLWQSRLPFPIGTFGTDVNASLPTQVAVQYAQPQVTVNPHYKGCITSTKVP